jgi:hypothetical protein
MGGQFWKTPGTAQYSTYVSTLWRQCLSVQRHCRGCGQEGQDQENLNQQLANRFNSRSSQFLFKGDILSGKNHCGLGDLVDCLFAMWRSDPVHGDKSAHLKLAMGLLDFLEPKPKPLFSRSSGRKRARGPSPCPEGCSPANKDPLC